MIRPPFVENRAARCAAAVWSLTALLAACAANGETGTQRAPATTVEFATIEDAAVAGSAASTSPSTTNAPPTTVPDTTTPTTTTTTTTVEATVPTTTAAPAVTLATLPPIVVDTVPITAPGETTTTTGPATTTTTTTSTTTTTTTTIPSDTVDVDLDLLLLTDSDLSGEWDVGEIESYVGRRDAEIAEACPAADALNRVDLELRWRTDSTTPGGQSVQQMVGAYDSATEASADVEEAALIASCDLSLFFFGSETSGGALDVPGADAASSFVVDSTDGAGAYVEVIVLAVGPVVSLIIVTATTEVDVGDDFVTAAVDRIVRLTR